jgi:hypothetical protein
VPNPQAAVPEAKAQRNFTDPESRIMKDGASKRFVQAYNCQATVDEKAQIITAAPVTQDPNDKQQLAGMLVTVKQNTGRFPQKGSADSGFFSTAQLSDERIAEVDLYVALGKEAALAGEVALSAEAEATCGASCSEASLVEQMRAKLQSAAGRAVYKLRKAIVEPVLGQIKEVRGFGRFSFRGLVAVSCEWKLICLTHHLLKLFGSGGWAARRAGTVEQVPGSRGGASSCPLFLVLGLFLLRALFARVLGWLSRPTPRLGFVH